MNQVRIPFSEVASASRRIVQQALDIGENRLELLMVEVQEARERLLQAVVLALAMAVCGLLAAFAFTIGIIMLFWNHSPLIAVAVMAGLYIGAAVYFHARFARLQRDWQAFPASLDQLRKDCKCLASNLH